MQQTVANTAEDVLVNNLLTFPQSRVVHSENLPDTELFHKRLRAQKVMFIDYVIAKNFIPIFGQLAAEGINVQSERFVHDFNIMMEMVRSVLYNSVDLKHPLQMFSGDAYEKFIEEHKAHTNAPYRLITKNGPMNVDVDGIIQIAKETSEQLERDNETVMESENVESMMDDAEAIELPVNDDDPEPVKPA